MRRHALAQRAVGIGDLGVADFPMPSTGLEGWMTGAPAEISDKARAENDDRKRNGIEKDCDKRKRRNTDC